MSVQAEQRRRSTDIEDFEVRQMLIKAGFDVTINDDVASFARFMRGMFVIYEAQLEARLNKSTTKRTLLVAVLSGFLTAMIPVVLKLLKVL